MSLAPHHRAPTTTDLRVFGVGLLVLAGIVAYRTGGHPVALGAVALGAVAAVLAAARPTVLSRPYSLWMRVFAPIGAAVTTVLLAVIYFVFLTPLAAAVRRHTAALVSTGRDASESTYWRRRDPAPPPDRAFKQY
ncbi:MAG: hypothetical protein H6698_09145 [Myxococcales bacterium]|nr:hypothetical protein [Myxococcales bacterium]MCB9534452.1 hypothetical protein [Myxococcales bacterium]